MSTVKSYGGKRQGAGRKVVPPDQVRFRVDVRLTQSEIDYLRNLGEGNLSAGIHRAIEDLNRDGKP